MNKIVEAKKEIRLKAWAEMCAEYQESGKTVTAWCEEKGYQSKHSTIVCEKYVKQHWNGQKSTGLCRYQHNP